ncbi:MAG: hypothetical protein FJ319_02365 [SAR202 cluster bacterium]|nr:hypothetical protein [SAR202 cluster bacterium]
MQSAMFMYTWDLRDEGIDAVLGRVRGWGVDAISLAASYHGGYVVHPHNPRHKVYMIEDGTVYFHPQQRYFADTPLKPKVAEVARDVDWFAAAGQRLDRYGMKLIAWTVCFHNTRLGLLHPNATVQNVLGDSYPHALCPSNESARLYARGLCRNLATEYPIHAIQIEATSFGGAFHDHHHQGYATVMEPVESWLMSLCFCEACRKQAYVRGVDIESAAEAARAHLTTFFSTAPVRQAGLANTKQELLERVPAFTAVEAMRREVEISLYQQISAPFRGGFRSANRQFIEPLPIRRIDPAAGPEVQLRDAIVAKVRRMLELKERLGPLRHLLTSERDDLQRSIE